MSAYKLYEESRGLPITAYMKLYNSKFAGLGFGYNLRRRAWRRASRPQTAMPTQRIKELSNLTLTLTRVMDQYTNCLKHF
jgi:hypothetical protein